MSGRILVGVIGAPHGVRGDMRLKSFTERPAAIADYGPLQSDDGRRRFTIVAARPLKDDMLVVRIEGIATREAAAALTGTRLMLDRAALPPAEEDEFYHADLVGLDAVTESGTRVGRVAAIVNFGAGDIVEIAADDGDSLLVGFTKAFVPVVDLAARRLVVADAALTGADDSDHPPEPGPR